MDAPFTGLVTRAFPRCRMRHARSQPPGMMAAAAEVVGEPVLDGVWFLTEPSPWYNNYPGTGTVLDLLLVLVIAPFIAYDYFRNAKQKDVAVLGHRGAIYCARTGDDLAFIASKTKNGTQQLTHVLRRYPERTLVSCDFEHSHKTAVDFVFEGGDAFTLQFEGVWSDLAEFFDPGSSMAHRVTNGG